MYATNDIRIYNELYHHGVLGQRKGVKNGPPYPLKPGDHSASEKKAGYTKSIKGGRNGGSSSKLSSNSGRHAVLEKAGGAIRKSADYLKSDEGKTVLKNIAVSGAKAAVKGAIFGPVAAATSISFDVVTGRLIGGAGAEHETFKKWVDSSERYAKIGNDKLKQMLNADDRRTTSNRDGQKWDSEADRIDDAIYRNSSGRRRRDESFEDYQKRQDTILKTPRGRADMMTDGAINAYIEADPGHLKEDKAYLSSELTKDFKQYAKTVGVSVNSSEMKRIADKYTEDIFNGKYNSRNGEKTLNRELTETYRTIKNSDNTREKASINSERRLESAIGNGVSKNNAKNQLISDFKQYAKDNDIEVNTAELRSAVNRIVDDAYNGKTYSEEYGNLISDVYRELLMD